MSEYNPKILAILCNWCSYAGADLAGSSRMHYPPNIRIIRVPCSGRIDPMFVLKGFQRGFDGVMVLGCHPGDCHYAEGNYKALRRFEMLKRLASQMGIEPQRLRLEWISASEGDKVRTVINDMVEQVRALGPLRPESASPGVEPLDGKTHATASAERQISRAAARAEACFPEPAGRSLNQQSAGCCCRLATPALESQPSTSKRSNG